MTELTWRRGRRTIGGRRQAATGNRRQLSVKFEWELSFGTQIYNLENTNTFAKGLKFHIYSISPNLRLVVSILKDNFFYYFDGIFKYIILKVLQILFIFKNYIKRIINNKK